MDKIVQNKIAIVFPGQGSQKLGMGKEIYDNFSAARICLQEIEDAVDLKLSDIMFGEDEAALTDTANAQPAIMACSLMIASVLTKDFGVMFSSSAKPAIQYAAGHSLGEYSALTVAGALQLTECAKLLRLRGNAMKQASANSSGAMAAILGLAEDKLDDICKNVSNNDQIAVIANDNSDGQIVISGDEAAISQACELAKEAGAKRAVPLPVSGAFHSPLMASATTAMEEPLASADIHKPNIDIIPNISVQPENNPEQLRKLLAEQITGRVRWRETMAFFAANNITHQIEIGNGNVLSGLAKRAYSKDVTIASINSVATIEEYAHLLVQ